MAIIQYYFYRFLLDPLIAGVRKIIKKMIHPDSLVLDIGCGTGELVFYLSGKANTVIGIDKDQAILKYAQWKKERLKIDNVIFLNKNINDMTLYSDYYFDYTVFSLFIHQITINEVDQIIEAVKECSRNIILADFNSPLPKNLSGLAARTIEWLAGGEHYCKFKEYQKMGGLDYIIRKHQLVINGDLTAGSRVFRVIKVSTLKPAD